MECVHHLTYARKYDEPIEDLAGWCNACHQFTHGKSDYDPRRRASSESRVWEATANEVFSGERGASMDRDDFIVFFDKEIGRSCDCGRCGGANTWAKMLVIYALGTQVIQKMGVDWLARASEGDFVSNDTSTDDLQKLITARRQEQGIS
jgi:hypothetical protein